MANATDKDVLIAQFNGYIEDLGRIGGRHEELRKFYVSVISALFVYVSLAGKDGVLGTQGAGVLTIVGLVGIAICALWFFHMRSFSNIFLAKIQTLTELEKELQFPFFEKETARLRGMSYTPLTTVDQVVAVVLGALFFALMYFKYQP
jgi:hypothetical protein